MIKINLKTQTQSSGAFLGNIDISVFNFPMIILATLFLALGPMILDGYLKSDRAKIQSYIDEVSEKIKQQNEELASLKDVEEKIAKMQSEEASIKNRVQVLQGLLKEKSNPMRILHYIADHIPSNLWMNKLEMSNKKVLIDGNTLEYASIGVFVKSLNESIFFDKSAKLDTYGTKQNNENTLRLEEFKISAHVARFE